MAWTVRTSCNVSYIVSDEQGVWEIMIWLICLIVSIILAALRLGTLNPEWEAGEMTKAIFQFVALFTFGVICLIEYLNHKSGRTAENKRRKKEAKELAARTIRARHQAGLPLAIDEPCVIINEVDCYVIHGGGNTFELKKDKVTAISVGPQFINQITYSDLGRTSNDNRMGITFTYQMNNEIKYMSFWLFYNDNINKAKRWSVEIGNRNVNRNRIQI